VRLKKKVSIYNFYSLLNLFIIRAYFSHSDKTFTYHTNKEYLSNSLLIMNRDLVCLYCGLLLERFRHLRWELCPCGRPIHWELFETQSSSGIGSHSSHHVTGKQKSTAVGRGTSPNDPEIIEISDNPVITKAKAPQNLRSPLPNRTVTQAASISSSTLPSFSNSMVETLERRRMVAHNDSKARKVAHSGYSVGMIKKVQVQVITLGMQSKTS
jgi:hypothetical protein